MKKLMIAKALLLPFIFTPFLQAEETEPAPPKEYSIQVRRVLREPSNRLYAKTREVPRPIKEFMDKSVTVDRKEVGLILETMLGKVKLTLDPNSPIRYVLFMDKEPKLKVTGLSLSWRI